MINKADNADQPASLPRSREALGALLEDLRKILEPLHAIQSHQRHRIEVIRTSWATRVPPSSHQREQLVRMALVGMQHWAVGVPPFDLVCSYLPNVKLGKTLQRLRRAAEVRKQATTRRPLQPGVFADALEAEVRLVEEFLTMLLDLQHRIMDALDGHADTRADRSKNSLVHPPRNPQVLELYIRLKNRDPEGSSESAFAVDFCDGDQRKAETLLRQVRRYRKRLKEAES